MARKNHAMRLAGNRRAGDQTYRTKPAQGESAKAWALETSNDEVDYFKKVALGRDIP